jgi:hypothetical protein
MALEAGPFFLVSRVGKQDAVLGRQYVQEEWRVCGVESQWIIRSFFGNFVAQFFSRHKKL